MKYIIFFACVIVFYFIYRSIMMLSYKGLDIVIKTTEKKFCFYYTLSYFLIFVFIYFCFLSYLQKIFLYSNIDYYIFFVVISIICALWCYISFDSKKIISKPKMAEKNEMLIKKTVLYTCIAAYTIYIGFQQLENALVSKEISISVKIVSCSMIAVFIAVDRISNSVWQIKNI